MFGCLFVLFCFIQVYGVSLEDRKGPLGNKILEVPEATPVPYAIFQVSKDRV